MINKLMDNFLIKFDMQKDIFNHTNLTEMTLGKRLQSSTQPSHNSQQLKGKERSLNSNRSRYTSTTKLTKSSLFSAIKDLNRTTEKPISKDN